MAAVSRDQVIAFRWRAHQLGRAPGTGTLADTALLDFGVQDTGPQGARWALANRGLEHFDDADVLLAWTLRVSPHLYRRADVDKVVVATAPFSEADAAKRIFDAQKPLREAGIPVLEALAEVARQQRAIVTKPMDKGSLSTALTPRLDPPYLRWCKPCGATHAWESPFRLAPLQAALELVPDTSPPVLRRIKGARPALFATSGTRAEAQWDVVRNYLRFYGPASIKDAATFLDSPVKEVKAHWPEDAEPVTVRELDEKEERFVLAGDLEDLSASPDPAGTVRLLGPYDAWLQLRDRATLVSDPGRAKDLWPTIGRPGTVARDGELVGTWRPRSSGANLRIAFEAWVRVTRALQADVEEQAERVAALRGQQLAGVDAA